MNDPLPIKGREQLESLFGHWPSFHDAEVLWLRLDRQKPSLGPTLETLIHTWQMTSETDADGHYVLRNHVLVHLQFAGVQDLKIEDLNHQNVLFSLDISPANPNPHGLAFNVHLDSTYGLDASFSCKSIEVLSVQPCGPKGNPT